MLRLINLFVLASLMLTGASLFIAIAIFRVDGGGWLKEQVVPTLIGIGTVGGWFAMVIAFLVFIVASVFLVIQFMRREGRAFLPQFYFSLLNAALGLLGVFFISYGRI